VFETQPPTKSQYLPDAAAPDRVAGLARLAEEAEATEIAADAGALLERLAEGRFYVACVGQFKRGKSTLLNALVGRPLLPAGVVPITTAVTVLRHGGHVRARVRLGAEWQDIAVDQIASYVSEEQNPANEKGVGIVEVFVPSALLATGMCLVDTPGIGSVVTANTEATQAFVPHIDAALVVIGADPPISGDEVALIEQVAEHVHDLIFVLNKADRLTDTERREGIAFARKVLAQRLGRLIGPIFEASATERLAGGNRLHDWQGLEAALATLAASTGAALVREAERRGSMRLAQRLLREIAEQRDALLRPLEESERRIATLRTCVADAERAVTDLGPLFAAEQARLSATFRTQWEGFAKEAVPAARREFALAMQRIVGHRSRVRGGAIHLAQDSATRWCERWFSEAEPAAEQLYRAAAQRFVEVANGFLERLATSDAALAGLPRSVSPELGFRTGSRFYSTELMHLTGRSPLQWLADWVLPPTIARRRVEREVGDYLERLVVTNTSRILNDLDERVRESRRRLEAEIRGYLHEVCTSAERALEHARSRRAAGQQAVQAEVERLEAIHRRVDELYAEERESYSPVQGQDKEISK
jgi:GTP-binding protein EngB required for normal cell division